MTREMVEHWIERYSGDLQCDSVCGQDAETILHDLNGRLTRLHEISDLVYGEWLERVMTRQVSL